MLIKVRGKTQFYNTITDFKVIKPGHYEATRNGLTYKIEGGRPAGGKRTDWFSTGPTWTGSIHQTSLLATLRMIDGH
jgi:hypothetical protein